MKISVKPISKLKLGIYYLLAAINFVIMCLFLGTLTGLLGAICLVFFVLLIELRLVERNLIHHLSEDRTQLLEWYQISLANERAVSQGEMHKRFLAEKKAEQAGAVIDSAPLEPGCQHPRVKELKFPHAEIHNSRYCQKCHIQEHERLGYQELVNDPSRTINTVRCP